MNYILKKIEKKILFNYNIKTSANFFFKNFLKLDIISLYFIFNNKNFFLNIFVKNYFKEVGFIFLKK